MLILFRLVLTLIGVFASRRKSRLSSMPSQDQEGRPYDAVFDSKNTFILRVELKKEFYFKIIPEGKMLKVLKFFGLDGEVQTGDRSFDDFFYIATDHPSLRHAFNHHSAMIESFHSLKDENLKKIQFLGRNTLEFYFTRKEKPEVFDELLKKVMAVKTELEKISVLNHEYNPFEKKIIVLELICYAITSYAISVLISYNFDPSVLHLDPLDLMEKGVYLGGVAFGCWFFISIFLLRKSSHLPLVISEFLFFGLLGFLVSGSQLIFDLNRFFDFSRPDQVQAHVVDKFYVQRGSGKGKSTSYYLRLKFDQNQFNLPYELEVPFWKYHDLTKGKGVEFDIKKGLFQSPYIDDIRPAEVKAGN